MLRALPFFFCFVSAVSAGTVLVLPFFNLSQASLDWMGESMAEAVREALASEGVLALSREDRMEAFRRLSMRPGARLTRASVIKAGEAVDAATVIYGHYEEKDGTLRITARILDLARSRQGPEFTELGALADLSALQTRLGWQALQFLAPKSAPSEADFLGSRPPVRVDAVENYIRGLLAAGIEQKHRFFTQAARLDASYSQPCFQLGKIYWDKRDYRIAAGWLERVRRSDSSFLEAQFYLGLCRYHLGDFAAAERCFQTVAAAVPLNEVYNNLGAAELRLGRASAAENFRKALEGDSADPDYHFNLGYALWKAGRYEESAESFRAALARHPEDSEATLFLGRALKKDAPRPGDRRGEGRERLKTAYEETAYRQLKDELETPK